MTIVPAGPPPLPPPWEEENKLSPLLVMLKLTERLLLLLLEEVVVDEECVMLTSGGGVNGGKPTIPVVEGWDTATASAEGITVERCGVDIGIADAVAAITTPVVEVHISNIFAREEYRHVSLLGKHCKGSISGFGLRSYSLALQSFL